MRRAVAALGVALFIAFFYNVVPVIIDFLIRGPFTVHPSGVVLVTGTSTGIGRHAAFELAKLNYTVFCTVRSEKDIHSMLQQASLTGLDKYIKPIKMDVTVKEQIDEALSLITAFLNNSGLPLVAIVHNAGIAPFGPIEVIPLHISNQIIAINYLGPLEITVKFLPLIRRDKGRIIFISSLAGFVSSIGNGVYSSSKAAIEALADSLRVELVSFGVSVSSILPGYIRTEIEEKLDSSIPPDSPLSSSPIYSSQIETLKSFKKSFKDAPGPEDSTKVIIQAITSPYPLPRYYCGYSPIPISLLQFLFRVLPDQFVDLLRKSTKRTD